MIAKRVVINASNLHVGGGIQVATSFLTELSCHPEAGHYHVIASTAVHNELVAVEACLERFASYRIFDTFGISALWSGLRSVMKQADVVFTVFGPLYLLRQRARSVVGFAQPWVIYPDNEVYAAMSWRERLITRLKYKLQGSFFAQADDLVVELGHVRSALIAAGLKPPDRVHVVPNCVNAVFFKPEQWREVTLQLRTPALKIGFVGRAYPHKNLWILPAVKHLLRSRHHIDVDFYVTLNPSEWNGASDDFRQVVVNAGPLTLGQCPNFYMQMDGVIFPSLLECFSATPLEAMVMKKPLFASDRVFVRQVCAEHAHYFEPTRPEHAAEVIAAYFQQDRRTAGEAIEAAHRHVEQFSDAGTRARRYLQLLSLAPAQTSAPIKH